MTSAELPGVAPDVLVVGAGNAALCAAISAHENGARVLMLEAAPFEERGGNSHFTGGAFRFAFAGVDDLLAVLPSLAQSPTQVTDATPPLRRVTLYKHGVGYFERRGRVNGDQQITFSFDAAQRREKLGALPEWDLSDLYPGPDSEPLARDLSALAEGAEAFRGRYEGGLAALSGAELGAAVEAYERLQEKIGRIMSYASLVHAGNLSDPEIGRFYQTMQERTNAVSTALLFFTLELNRLKDAELEAKLADPALAYYRPWLRDIRAFRPHQLSDEIEKLLHEKYVAGRAAWTRLFEETIADSQIFFDRYGGYISTQLGPRMSDDELRGLAVVIRQEAGS